MTRNGHGTPERGKHEQKYSMVFFIICFKSIVFDYQHNLLHSSGEIMTIPSLYDEIENQAPLRKRICGA